MTAVNNENINIKEDDVKLMEDSEDVYDNDEWNGELDEGYCSTLDELGCVALELETTEEETETATTTTTSTKAATATANNNVENKNKTKEEDESMARALCIRLQAKADVELDTVKTVHDILNKISEVRQYQQQLWLENQKDRLAKPPRVDLYRRRWKMTTGPNNSEDPKSPKTSLSSSCFTILQFNTLAEGLSSGPTVKTPFQPRDNNNNNPANKQGNNNNNNNLRTMGNSFGGLTSVPNPDIVLNFALRRWRILEVLLGQYIYNNDESNPQPDDAPRRNSLNEEAKVPSLEESLLFPFDIIAMEEVDRYHGFFEPALSILGYRGIFMPKPRAPGVTLGWYSDGCALFWRSNIFELISQRRLCYSIGTQVCIVALLQHIVSKRHILVAVTHLKAQNGDANERTRVGQVQELVDVVMDMSKIATEKVDAKEEEAIPIILAGDFNATPNAPCIQTLLNAHHSHPRRPQKRFHSSYPIEPPTPNDNNNKNNNNNIPFTTWKTRGERTSRRIIDYIFHNGAAAHHYGDFDEGNMDDGKKKKKRKNSNEEDHTFMNQIRCKSILSIPKDDEEELKLTHLPGFRYPSDHLAVAATFEMDYKS